MSPSRRSLLATAGASFATLAGCTGLPREMPAPPDDPGVGDRPTATARDPDPLDVSGTWPQRGGDAGHGGVTDASGAPRSGRLHWHLRRVRSGPAVLSDGRLFHYAKLGEVTGGRPTLTRTREPDAGTAHPVYGEAHLVARDASEGRIEWAERLPDPGSGWPAVGGGAVVAAVRSAVIAYDVTDGTERWSHGFDGRPVGSPTVDGDAVVVPLGGIGSGDPNPAPAVRVYDLASGEERWTTTPRYRAVEAAVAGDVAVSLAHDYDGSGVVRALSLSDGSERWRREVTGEFAFAGPVVAGETVYVAGSGGRLRALSLSDGSERWTVPGVAETVAADGDAVYGVTRDALSALDAADGTVDWSVETDGEGYDAAPAVDRSTVYAGEYGAEASVRAYARSDGSDRWSYRLPDAVVEGDMITGGVEAQPTVAGGALYAYAADGLYAFGPE